MKTFKEEIKQTIFKKIIKEEKGEGGQYKPRLKRMAEKANKINMLIKDGDDLPAWVQDKITLSYHNLEAVLDYLEDEK